jgi:hypothetical protein
MQTAWRRRAGASGRSTALRPAPGCRAAWCTSVASIWSGRAAGCGRGIAFCLFAFCLCRCFRARAGRRGTLLRECPPLRSSFISLRKAPHRPARSARLRTETARPPRHARGALRKVHLLAIAETSCGKKQPLRQRSSLKWMPLSPDIPPREEERRNTPTHRNV